MHVGVLTLKPVISGTGTVQADGLCSSTASVPSNLTSPGISGIN